MAHGALMHDKVDDVAVVVQDVAAGTEVRAVTLEGEDVAAIKAVQDIPLGHKIAVRSMDAGKEVVKYASTIGKTTEAIAEGAHVHIHNLKSIRWA